MELCTSKQEHLIGVLVELKSVNLSESCLLKPKELEISPYIRKVNHSTKKLEGKSNLKILVRNLRKFGYRAG